MGIRLRDLPFSRKYLITAAGFGLLLAAAFWLFATLLVGQLSRSYLEDVLLSGRTQAQEIAKAVEGEASLYHVVERRREKLDKISLALARQEVVESVQVYDDRGKLVYQTILNTDKLTGGFPEANPELWMPPTKDNVVEETQNEYQIRTPLSDIGTVVVRIPKEAMAGRIDELRSRLLWRAGIAGGVMIVVLALAVAFIWHLIQRNAELDERRRINEELAALGTLAANLAHEIRNPLNAISINLELLEEELGERLPPPDSTALARREVGRLARLVNDFLVYARPATPSPEAVGVPALLQDVEALLRPECDRAGIELEVKAADLVMHADRAQLHQVLVNLAQNACQAVASSPRKRVILEASADDERVIFDITDTGPGIAKGDLGKVREAFFSRRKGGTGLGLAIAERIVDSHGGHLELFNRPEGGLRARIVLPRAPGKSV
ncbi:MAG TPA: ATP-binding protein [Thermoanaerobaculaceae bacterium]|nr:ATP-binding protein [Thermoanaerobaculaceae bacterium]HPS76924.1 ATP-binding protein [Thermoanaerobaculaceae bacterium]